MRPGIAAFLPGCQILAFADHSYLIDIGCDRKVLLIVIGWYRWHPDSIEFARWGCGRWPKDDFDDVESDDVGRRQV